ncbi:MAG: methyltransferase domain-containing protein [Myxococcota bacterium]|nr:methyltransferase domain-containing protein [Myxococcota bacterium]
MRVVDLDRDMRDVIPTGTSRDSEYLFQRMTDCTLERTRPGPGRRILDVAAGLGQDAAALAERGAWVVGAEPSARMTDLARLAPGRESFLPWVRSWSDALPFADASFDGVICKGAIDHFDQPRNAISEMARVTRPDGRVVLAIANFESAACRVARSLDAAKERWLGRELPRGRRHYDVPHDHFTRYELGLMREQASEWLELDSVEGVSLAWGLPGWNRCVEGLPEGAAQAALRALDWLAARLPALADVVVLAGRPRRAAMAST